MSTEFLKFSWTFCKKKVDCPSQKFFAPLIDSSSSNLNTIHIHKAKNSYKTNLNCYSNYAVLDVKLSNLIYSSFTSHNCEFLFTCIITTTQWPWPQNFLHKIQFFILFASLSLFYPFPAFPIYLITNARHVDENL